MLESVKIARRQSEIRQSLSELSGKEKPSEDELRSMSDLDTEYRQNEVKYRAALIAEDTERKDAGKELETREGRERDELVQRFEMRQVALHLDEGRVMDGATAELVSELRAQGGYRGVPVPWAALELRVGETIASGTPDPIQTRPIIDRLFPASVAARMGGNLITIESGGIEWPVVTSSVSAGWADGETANVAGPTVYATTDKALQPEQTLGIQMKITRKALKQSGDALEQAVRRDMNGAIAQELDRAVFQGAGANGEPAGIIANAVATYGIASSAVNDAASWAIFRDEIVQFMVGNAASMPSDVRVLMRPEIWGALDDTLISGTAFSELDRMLRHVPAGNLVMSSNALDDPGSPASASALLTTSAGGVAPFFVGTWGAIDLIRDPYSDAQSGGLRLTALATMDVTVARPAQSRVLTAIG